MRVFVSACVRVSVARQHACVCTCQCCTPTCVRVLRACMCTCGVRLHVSRLTFSSLVIRFSSRWIRNQGPAVYHQTPPPSAASHHRPNRPPPPPAAGPPAPKPPPPAPLATPLAPSPPPRAELFLRGSPPHRPMNAPQPPVTANQRSHDFEYPPTTNLLPFLSFIYALTGGPYGNVRC